MANGAVSRIIWYGVDAIFGQEHYDLAKVVYPHPEPIKHVSEFWYTKHASLSIGQYVSISGALSLYAPFLVGSPKAKREMHLDFRRKISSIEKKVSATDIDAFLGFSAGQMVIRLSEENMEQVYLGLYHSIIRNSIPVFVDKKYFNEIVKSYFYKKAHNNVIEAELTGRIVPISNIFMDDLIEDFNLKGDIKPAAMSEQHYAIEVKGPSNKTGITYVDEARYLDGDIWFALRSENEERFISRFIDLSDVNDVKEQRKALARDVDKYEKDSTLIMEYDQLDRMFTQDQSVDQDIFLKRKMKNRFDIKE